MRIARFVDMEACRSIFSDYSTFVLRSSEYYRRNHETDKGDGQELEVRTSGGGSAETSGFVLSCWTMLDGDEPSTEEWNVFPDSVVAILSTPSRVGTFLESTFDIENGKVAGRRKFPFLYVTHRKVQYEDEVADITSDNICDKPVFTKRSRFAKQKEYRFALPYSAGSHDIDSYILSSRPDDYTDKRFANPEMCREQKTALRLILMKAMAGYGHFSNKTMPDIIANTDVLF